MSPGLRRRAGLLAVLLALAGAMPSSAAGAVRPRPDTTVISKGDCGTVTLDVQPASTAGRVAVSLRASSGWGPMFVATWRAHWANQTLGTGSSISGSQVVLSDVMTWSTLVTTGRGSVTVVLDRFEATLWWGMRCVATGLTASAWVP